MQATQLIKINKINSTKLFYMSFFKQQLSKLVKHDALDLKSYITKSTVEDFWSRWNYKKLWINVDFDRPKAHSRGLIVYGYRTFAHCNGDYATLNERSYFTTKEEAFGEITRQVFEVSDLINDGFVVIEKHAHQNSRNVEYLSLDFHTMDWVVIDYNNFQTQLSK